MEDVRHKIGHIMQSNDLIINLILENFNNTELEKMKKVCSMWKSVAEQIIKKRIRILSKAIPYKVLEDGITKPDVIIPFIGIELEPNIEFITEFRTFVTGINQDSTSRVTSSAYQERHIFTQIAIFPRICRIHLHRFSFTWNENISKISDEINVPEKEIKCLLLFINGNIEDVDYEILPMCSIGGLFSTFTSLNLYRGIAILGENVKAVSFPLLDEEVDGDPESISYVYKLKQYNIDRYKCIAFIFTDRNYSDCCTLSEFKDIFPDAPILIFNFGLVFGSSYFPALNEQQNRKKIFTSDVMKTIGLFLVLWYN